MHNHRNDLINSSPRRDVLFAYRKRIWSYFGAICIALFLPGSIYIYLEGHKWLAIAVLGMLCIFALNAYSILRSKAPQLTMSLFVVSLMLATGMSLIERGVYGVFWTFPAILLINFVGFGRLARIHTAIYFAVVGFIMFYRLDPQIAVRAVIGLIMTVLFTNIFLGMIEKLQNVLVEQSNLDPLTGALNRRPMDSILDEAIERKRRTQTPASLLVFDVDHFKSVNDTFGHAIGDYVLKELVTLLQSRCRRLDKLFRLGGEEFMIFLPDTPGFGAVSLAEELRSLVSEAGFIEDRVITISIGISELEHGETTDEWIKRGDDALFSAKHNGRNRAVAAIFPETIAGSFIDPLQGSSRPAESLSIN